MCCQTVTSHATNQSVQSACLNRRKYALLGESEADAARIDMLVDGVEDIKRK